MHRSNPSARVLIEVFPEIAKTADDKNRTIMGDKQEKCEIPTQCPVRVSSQCE